MRNDIYTNLENYINTQERPVRFTQTYELVPNFLPCVYFRESHYVTAHEIPFGSGVEDSTVYLNVYSVTNPDGIVKDIETRMASLGYIERECMLVDNADPTIERVSMTFNRVIARGEMI